ncbi:hypothetical protein_gp258 [Bacillus phage vB_BceM_WH1]|nr:hypothetical protein_gp258 [Bacillus phage vB_BceM_WH1]
MRTVYLSSHRKEFKVYAIIEEEHTTDFLIKEEYQSDNNPYHLAEFFDAEVTYVDKEFHKYEGTKDACYGFVWIEEDHHWHYTGRNSDTVYAFKKEDVI